MKFISLSKSIVLITISILVVLPLQIILNFLNLEYRYVISKFFFKFINFLIGINVDVNKEDLDLLKKIDNAGTLYIANHVTWMDILILGSLLKSKFIAKKEVKKMGIFGFLAIINNTFFIDNTKTLKSLDYITLIKKELLKGNNLILFPEGTTSDGNGLITFKSSFFESANSTYICPTSKSVKYINVQTLTLSYIKNYGLPMGTANRRQIAWIGNTPVLNLMFEFLMSGCVTVNVKISEPITIEDFKNRKHLAAYCENKIFKNLINTIQIKA